MLNHFFANTTHRCISQIVIVSLLFLLIAGIIEKTTTNVFAQDETGGIELQQQEDELETEVTAVVIDVEGQERQQQIAEETERLRELVGSGTNGNDSRRIRIQFAPSRRNNALSTDVQKITIVNKDQ